MLKFFNEMVNHITCLPCEPYNFTKYNVYQISQGWSVRNLVLTQSRES